MEKLVITEHSSIFCKNNKEVNWFDGRTHTLKCNESVMAFQLDYNFYVLIYPNCLDAGDHLDIKGKFLDAGCKVKSLSSVQRGVRVNSLSRQRDVDLLIKSNITEVCYLYGHSIEYCFTRDIKYSHSLITLSSYYQEYAKAIEVINQDEVLRPWRSYLESSVEALYSLNQSNVPRLSEYREVELTDKLISNIIKYARN